MEQSSYRQVKHLFEYASSLDVDEVYEKAGKPYPAKALANTITPLVIDIGRESGEIDGSISYSVSEDGSPSLLLWRGIDDTQRVLVPRLELQRTYNDAANFIKHEKTLHGLAHLALRHYEHMYSLIDQLEYGKYRPAEPTEYFELPHQESSASMHRGCPAAKHTSIDTIKPVWKDFALWVGELSLKGIVEHRRAVKPAFFEDLRRFDDPQD